VVGAVEVTTVTDAGEAFPAALVPLTLKSNGPTTGTVMGLVEGWT
jgi:hypothetical protein